MEENKNLVDVVLTQEGKVVEKGSEAFVVENMAKKVKRNERATEIGPRSVELGLRELI